MYARFFAATYEGGYAYLGKGHYYAGSFAVHLLNDFYKDDLSARLSVFKTAGWQVLDLLKKGCITAAPLLAAGQELYEILTVLPKLKPFSLLNVEVERQHIRELFTAETASILQTYYRQRAFFSQAKEIQVILDTLPEHDKDLLQRGSALEETLRQTIALYHSISDDLRDCFHGLKHFVAKLDEIEHYDEGHLLPLAIEVFPCKVCLVETEYVSIQRTKRSAPALARSLIFGSLASFLLTDFFEGLHHGHYPRRCEICGKYFLMRSARHQRYCGGWSGVVEEGRKLSCRQYAASISKKELAGADPRKLLYSRRCACIRSEQSRGTITPEFATAAKTLAKRCLNKAIIDPDYASTKFEMDLQREKLYADTKAEVV